jgi:hypothetical protein
LIRREHSAQNARVGMMSAKLRGHAGLRTGGSRGPSPADNWRTSVEVATKSQALPARLSDLEMWAAGRLEGPPAIAIRATSIGACRLRWRWHGVGRTVVMR